MDSWNPSGSGRLGDRSFFVRGKESGLGKNFGAIIGVIALFIGAGAGLGPWLGGYIYDRFGNYDSAFWIAILLAAVSLLFIWLAGPSRDRPRPGF